MKLRTKTLLITAITLASLIAVLNITMSKILLDSFGRADDDRMRVNMQRALEAYRDELDQLNFTARDWAEWDDTYAFVADNNQDYRSANLQDKSIAALNLNLLVFVHSSGRIVFGTGFGPEKVQALPLPRGVSQHFMTGDALVRHGAPEVSKMGLLMLPDGPMLVASRAILTSAGTGPERGTLIMGRFLSGGRLNRLAQRTHLVLTARRFDDPRMPSDFQVDPAALLRKEAVVIRPSSKTTITASTLIRDIYGRPGLVLRINSDRVFYQQGRVTARYLLMSLLVVGLTFGALALLLLERCVLLPLSRLSTAVARIGAGGDLSVRLPVPGKDELSRLAADINGTLEALQHAQSERQSIENRYWAVVEQTSEAIFLMDQHTKRLLEANPAFHDLLGYTDEEIDDLTLYDLTEYDRGVLDIYTQRILAGQHAPAIEGRLKRKDGSTVDVEATVNHISYGERTVLSVVARDITERKQAEVAIREARDEAEQANRAKSEFLSRMSHELRTPLNAILGFSQLLGMDGLEPEQCESVEQILKAGRHLLGLIDEVLDIARVEAGHVSLSPEPVLLQQLAEESLSLVRPLATQRMIQVEAALPTTWQAHVFADRRRLTQVLVNLLANAVKYNRDGGRVTLAAAEVSAGLVRIVVRDTGPGIAAEKLPRLFIPFERLGAEQSAVEGAGLGLALSKGLVELMGGRIGVESVVGQGSAFWVEFPLVEGPVERLERLGGDAARANGTLSHAFVVLYIEDNLSNVRLVERIMAHRPGVELLPAMQGSLGLELARNHHPDLILLDLNLPDLEGDEVLRRLRDDPATRAIPVVVISADAMPGRIKQLREAGAHDYVTKPLDVAKLLGVMDELLAQGVH